MLRISRDADRWMRESLFYANLRRLRLRRAVQARVAVRRAAKKEGARVSR
ncbi:MAG TPA: hypothetical protein VGV59_03385 [Pyrinomonadaceae bacterium]|nr:hypothetical protein [Pyrinomonadaceae bacterium]